MAPAMLETFILEAKVLVSSGTAVPCNFGSVGPKQVQYFNTSGVFPLLAAPPSVPFEDEPISDEEEQWAAEGRAELARGETTPSDDVWREVLEDE